MAKSKKPEVNLSRPLRDPDYHSKRGIPYWWSPEWVRDLNGSICRVKPMKDEFGEMCLYMLSKKGEYTYILGSIQQEFRKWHEDRKIDYILLGEEEDFNKELETNWEELKK
jgi:hypothetical protein